MSKSVLVIDTPESCGRCKLTYYDRNHYDCFCSLTGEFIDHYNSKTNCPLVPLPSHKVLPSCMQRGDTKSMTHLIEDIMSAGYNKCLDDLQKGVKNER